MQTMNLWLYFRYLPIFLFGFSPTPAMAHLVSTDVGEFYAGMMHPVTSTEHLLPTLAVALLASQLGQRYARRVVLLFPLMLAVGIALGYHFQELVLLRSINLILLPVLGVFLVIADRISTRAAIAFSVGTGLVLGCRSGVDMANAAVGMQFVPGVVLTGLIMMVLFAAWIPVVASKKARTLRTIMGCTFCLAGVAMILAPVSGFKLQNIRTVGLPGADDIVGMVKLKELTPAAVLTTLIGALIWGAGHALTPGHGKAIVAAYLVGARSTPWHAIYLGLTVTATHTLMVFALGAITLFASHFILPEQLYPWLGLSSGLMVVGLGAAMAATRMQMLKNGDVPNLHFHPEHTHDHDVHSPLHDHIHDHHHEPCDHHHHHGHSHLPPGAGDAPVTWRSLLGLGVSGGLLPCPAALVLLLAAVSLGRVGFGMILVMVFSLGLAGVLIAVGLLFIKGGQLLVHLPQVSTLGKWLPAVSAVAVFAIGIAITIQAAGKI